MAVYALDSQNKSSKASAALWGYFEQAFFTSKNNCQKKQINYNLKKRNEYK
jgi:hypothetical protein